MKLKEKELWLELYEIAEKIQKLEPWNYLWDTDLLVYFSDSLDDVFYCSVMGRTGMHKAIAIYQGEQIHGYLKLMHGQYPAHTLINYQECLTCNFLNRQETLTKNREIIKELELKFRGTWISFENFEKGYEPSPINIKQVKVMIEALKNFYMMFRAIIEQKMRVDFDKGEVLIRKYNKEQQLFFNYVDSLILPRQQFDTIKISKEFENVIMELPQTEMELEYEFLNYIPIKIRDNKEQDGRNYYLICRILAESKSNFLISQDLVNKTDYKNKSEYITESIELLISYFYQYGRPKKIYVRDEETKMFLMDVANKAKIKLIVKPTLKAIDGFYYLLGETKL